MNIRRLRNIDLKTTGSLRYKPTFLVFCVLWYAGRTVAAEPVEFALVEAPPPPPTNSFKPWPSPPPADCPFTKSDTIVGVAFTGRHGEYTGADTWYPSWAVDGNLYSPC